MVEFWNPRIETLPKKELIEIQERLLKAQINSIYHRSSYYHKMMEEASLKPVDIRNFDDLIKFPINNKDQIRENRNKTGDPWGGTLCVGENFVIENRISTGTSGDSTYIGFTNTDIRNITEMFCRHLWGIGVRPGMTTSLLTIPWHAYIVGLNRAFDLLGLKRWGTGFPSPLDVGRMIDAIDFFRKEDKTAYSYSAVDASLALEQILKERGINPKDYMSDRITTHTGDIMTPKLRKHFLDELGGAHYSHGGLGDLWWVLNECQAMNGLHWWEDMIYTEVLDANTGERIGPGELGELTLTGLIHEAMPLVRFATDDIGKIEIEKCDCGRTHGRAWQITRRKYLMTIKGAKQKHITPFDIEEYFKTIPEMYTSQFSFVKDKKGELDQLWIKTTYDATSTKDPEELRQRLENGIEKEFGVKTKIEFVTLGELPVIFHKIDRVIDMTKEK
ncbi:MAG: phenylacetate--CoA ligase family protein [Candidatus Hodarchaeota archaeon]